MQMTKKTKVGYSVGCVVALGLLVAVVELYGTILHYEEVTTSAIST